jgi:hypothetical protein
MCCSAAFWNAVFSGEKSSVYFIEGALKGIEEEGWL